MRDCPKGGSDKQYLSPEPLLQNPGDVTGRAEDGQSMPTYAYASNNPLSNIDPDGLLDYQISCPSRGRPSYWIHPPGNTYCEDCKDVNDAAQSFCAAGLMTAATCSCRALTKLADKICKGCQSTQPPPAPPLPPPQPLPPPRPVACR